ncbi:MAG TPA: AbrB/MazE/SpoVT family DNA-binding domain-containing protein [Anaerolineae bacterium]|nr:AbrB/MazE/SpoVT family DNA-binding domain-containing protein [Anaerolineae bacterium]
MVKDPTLTKVTRNGQITLPAAVRRAANIEEGDLIAVVVEGDTIRLSPQKLIDKSQAYFWSDDWQKSELEASEDIESGRIQEFDDIDALIDALEAGEA